MYLGENDTEEKSQYPLFSPLHGQTKEILINKKIATEKKEERKR